MMKKHLQSIVIPLLAAIYPVFFIYNNNVKIIRLGSLVTPLVFVLLLTALLYGLFYFLTKRQPARAALASLVFLVFFYLYGPTYDWLVRADFIQVEHYTLLPLMAAAGLYAGLLLARALPEKHLPVIQQVPLFIVGGLLLFNLVGIVPAELQKAKIDRAEASTRAVSAQSIDREYPDIYYFVFDEFAGFNAMREYWQYDAIEPFIDFLKTNGFYVADRSTSPTYDTLVEVSSRLNYEQYEVGEGVDFYFEKINNNRLFDFLKSKGYTTVIFDETRASFAYPSKPPVNADISYEFDPNTMADQGVAIDDFGQMVMDITMLRPLTVSLKQNNPVINNHRNMVWYTFKKVAALDEVPSPKVVYIHLMLPHMPFVFDASGNAVDSKYHQDWNYYLGNYIYTTKLIEESIPELLANSDPARPPVIILQSDHGARNKKTGHPDSENFADYPEEYKYDLMFAMYIPGYDYSTLPATIDPINTFPIVLNHYFDAGIPLK